MSSVRKVRVSVSLSKDLLKRVDREVARSGRSSRSSVVEAWLETGRLRADEERLRLETIAYYANLDDADREDDDAWSQFATREFTAKHADERS